MKATQSLASRVIRLPLTTKSARKGFYKGNGVKVLGHWDKANPRKFIPDYEKVRTYVFPEQGLEGFKLTPFVSNHIEKFEQEDQDAWSVPAKKITGEEYLDLWKSHGGHDYVGEIEQMQSIAEPEAEQAEQEQVRAEEEKRKKKRRGTRGGKKNKVEKEEITA